MYGTLYRHVLLPLFDRVVKGRKTLAYWDDAEKSQWLTAEEHAERQLQALRNLVRHASQTCPYYRADWEIRGLQPSQLQSFGDLAKWPLIDRNTITTHRLQMRTTLPLRLISKGTGGSSGVPLRFDLDSDSNDRRTALMHRAYGWGGAAPGTRQLRIWGGPLSTLPWWKRVKQGLHSRFDRQKLVNCFEFTESRMHEHFLALNRYRPEAIVAYTTPLYEFARYLDQHDLIPFAPQGIIVGAEKLHDFQRDLIEKVFAAPVFETYGSREVMLIGAECERHEGLHLSQENLYVEILNDDGSPTSPGEEGNVVVTDLFNYGMPFIRYVNGDRAVAGWKQCGCGRGLPLLTRVTGRRLDTLLTPDGRKVPGEFFPHLLKEFDAIRRFQVVQKSPRTITLKLVAPQFPPAEQARLLQAVHSGTGTAVEIAMELVDDIPLTGAGKHKVVVREFE